MTTQKSSLCCICGEFVEPDATDAHLADKHPAPRGGFRFTFDAAEFYTDKPSMSVLDLLALVGRGDAGLYTLYQGDHEVVGNAVDVTREPQFFLVPPARY